MNNNDKIYKIAKTQVDFVKSVLGKRFSFEDNNTNETNGGYTTYGTLETPTALIIVRVSNHICSMDNWTQRYKPKRIANKKLARRMGNNLQPPYKDRCFFSVVFKAFDYQPNDVGSWRAICNEYTFDPFEIEENGSLGNIAQDCLKLNSNKSVSINGQAPTQRIAQKGNTIENNQQIKENKKMNNKQTIRLNENQLKRIVMEAVNDMLKEYSDATTDGAITYQRSNNKEIEDKLLYNRLRHLSSLPSDKSKENREKNKRYNEWDGKSNHGQAALVPFLKVIDKARKLIDDEFLDNTSIRLMMHDNEFQDKVRHVYSNITKTLKHSFVELRNLDERIKGRVSDYKGM